MSEKYQKTYPISWEQLHRDSKALAWRLLDQREWQGIVAITRGGAGTGCGYFQRAGYSHG